MTIHQLIPAGSPELHHPAWLVQPGNEDYVNAVIEDMWRIMRNPEARAIGLAAPQIGVRLQIITIEDPPELQAHLTEGQLTRRGREPVAPMTLINPEYIVTDKRRDCFFEGCLTYPGMIRAVLRHRGIRVYAIDENRTPVEFHADGWLARAIQHEIDHLNGVTLTTINHKRPKTAGAWVSEEAFRRKNYVDFTSDKLRRTFKLGRGTGRS